MVLHSVLVQPTAALHKTLVLALLTFLTWLLLVVAALPDEDRVHWLPLFGPPPTPQYSGYLNATDGCDLTINGNSCQIHYWMALAQGDDWQRQPVVLFLNGGPGASSLLGFLQEVGPLLILSTSTGTTNSSTHCQFVENPYSWNTIANLVVMESPVGVGFSYCANLLCTSTDTFTASAARAATVDLFTRKFPELRDNDFFITGESYAGVYIPMLANEILHYNHHQQQQPINLRGIAVGAPCTDNHAQHNSMDPIWYAHNYGLVDDTLYETLQQPECREVVVEYVNSIINHLDNDLVGASMLFRDDSNHATKSRHRHDIPTTRTMMTDADCTLAIRKLRLSTSDALSGKWPHRFIDRFSLFGPVTDVVDQAMVDYLNRRDVQEALHVSHAPIAHWTKHSTNETLDYIKEYNACNRNAKPDAPSMIDVYRKIVPQLDKTWIYNGDTDPAVSYEGTRTAVKRIGFRELDGGGYRPWFYNRTATSRPVLQHKPVRFGPDLVFQNLGAQFGGEVVNYEHNLAFLTVHGSGHMVPQFRPQAALHLLTKLIQPYQDLSPLLPSNATLSNMSGKEFATFLDAWTESAKAAPFVYWDAAQFGEHDAIATYC